jgi:hypothetical protein
MLIENLKTDNPFILKRQGKFHEALLAYAQQYAEALREGNEYKARVCFDQMVDIRLLELLRERRTFANTRELKYHVRDYLAEILQEVSVSQDSLHEHFDISWAKFPRRREGRPLFSVGKEQLVQSKSNSREEHAETS